MKFVSVRELRSKTGSVWKNLKRDRQLVLTSNGKPVALVIPVDEETMEDSVDAVRRAQAMGAVERMQEMSAKAGLDRMTLPEINALIREVRKEYHS